MKSLWILVVLAACGGLGHSEDTLGESVRSFNDSVRWARFDYAAVHLPPAERAKWVDEWDERAKDVKITDYDIVKLEQHGREARVQVKIEWYKDSEGKVRQTHAMQTWERHGKHWLMVDETRVRGTEMPGLAEPAEAAEPAVAKD